MRVVPSLTREPPLAIVIVFLTGVVPLSGLTISPFTFSVTLSSIDNEPATESLKTMFSTVILFANVQALAILMVEMLESNVTVVPSVGTASAVNSP